MAYSPLNRVFRKSRAPQTGQTFPPDAPVMMLPQRKCSSRPPESEGWLLGRREGTLYSSEGQCHGPPLKTGISLRNSLALRRSVGPLMVDSGFPQDRQQGNALGSLLSTRAPACPASARYRSPEPVLSLSAYLSISYVNPEQPASSLKKADDVLDYFPIRV